MKKTILYLTLIYSFFNIDIDARVLPQDVIWNNDETGYYTIDENSIVLVSTIGKKDKKILSSEDVKNKKIESFSFSQDKKNVLIFTNSVRVWRYNTRGNYWVYNLKTKQGKRLGSTLPDRSIMFAKFSPNGKKIFPIGRELSKHYASVR